MKLNLQIVAATTLAGLLLVGCNQQANSSGTSAAAPEDPATQSLPQATAPASTNDATASTNTPSSTADQPTNTTDRSGLRETDIATSTNEIPPSPPMPVTPQ
jgi:uncharacterized lipoprotein NlpE involved in copper resistance